ncbi:MAG: HigA family addiction module antitoxin [Acidimicrobiales bacterium]
MTSRSSTTTEEVTVKVGPSIAPIPPRRTNEIVHGTRRLTADTALRLARYFETSQRFWINLQSRYDLEAERDRIGPALAAIEPRRSA